jgi:demethylmenaquinone methyltransferase / 2-methoxy-6-polyprenyl-1,4-benzoquinol methylase
MSEPQTHFGFRRIDMTEKTARVKHVFASVASRYDLMNDLMSGGLHRLWKDHFVRKIHAGSDAVLLDVAGGTGDIARRLYTRTGADVTILDINEAMLATGRGRMIDAAKSDGLRWVCSNAEALPLPDRSVDVYTVAFGLRNVTDIPQALREARRVLKPGGQFLCLEFSHVTAPLLKELYELYSFQMIPRLGAWITKDAASYQYLVESIRMFPPPKTLVRMLEDAGFSRVDYEPLSLGIVAIHRGWRV